MLPLALFSDRLSYEKKDELRHAMLTVDVAGISALTNRHGTSYGKPNFPELTVPGDLLTFVGCDSMGFFRILHLDSDFLSEPAEEWPGIDSYESAKKGVKAMHVVNDAAERGVKLASDFLESAKLEDNYKNILQVAENDRQRTPNQRKRGEKSKSWYLTL